jgi:hypothetical protein
MTEADEMPELLTPREAARYLRTTTNSLAQDRYLNRGVAFHKVGKRVLYARADVEAYLAAGRTDPRKDTVPPRRSAMSLRVVKVPCFEVVCTLCERMVDGPYISRLTAETALPVAQRDGHDCTGPEGEQQW